MRSSNKLELVPIEKCSKGPAVLGQDEIRGNEMWQRYVADPIMRFRELLQVTQVGRSKAYELMDPKSRSFDPDYPTGFPLFDSPRSPKGYWRHEAMAWIESRSNKFRNQKKGN